MGASKSRGVADEPSPAVDLMLRRAEDVRTAELSRTRSRLSTLTADERAALDAATRAMVEAIVRESLAVLERTVGAHGEGSNEVGTESQSLPSRRRSLASTLEAEAAGGDALVTMRRARRNAQP